MTIEDTNETKLITLVTDASSIFSSFFFLCVQTVVSVNIYIYVKMLTITPRK
ncbi:hypothetical protein C0J52_08578 [Blattella germanica]|nr:hypothetical protein C0J52_08578 [Blattella germanica]